jgi:uncharacterized membrane protein YdjX (TVP38/TMEM64 family)
MDDPSSKAPDAAGGGSRRRMRLWTIGVIAIVGCAAVTYYGYEPLIRGMTDLLEWTNGLGPWAPVAFIGIVVVAILFLVPGLLLSLGAGFMFGVVKGVAVMWIATNIGAALAFLIGRHAMGDRFARFLFRHAKAKEFNEVLKLKGWKVVMLTRMVPFFPFKLSNYVFGFAGFSLPQFCLGTALGIFPITIFNVYTGSLAADLTALTQPNPELTTLGWAFRVGGLVAGAVFLVYTTHLARKALQVKAPSAVSDSGSTSTAEHGDKELVDR